MNDLPFRPVVEVDLAALLKNYRLLVSAAKGAEVAGVVKCDAYGLGAAPVAAALSSAGCRSFFVAWPDEGARLREALGDGAVVYVFNGPDVGSLPLFRERRLTPVLNSLAQAQLWRASGGGQAALHLDTGINRLGVPAQERAAIAALGLDVVLVMSHLACSSEPGHCDNARQRDAFLTAAALWPEARRSLAASAGTLMGGDYLFDLVRPGAALYGVSPFDAPDPLIEPRIAPVARLTAPVLETFEAPAGGAVGYGGAHVLGRPSRLAAVGFGYGDGLHRAACGRARVALGGALCPLVGRVSMDLVVADVTDAGPVAVGERAEFFGPALPLDVAAAAMDTIGYEVLTSLGRRVLRLYRGAPAGGLASASGKPALTGPAA